MIVVMESEAQTAAYLAGQGERVEVVQVRLFRPSPSRPAGARSSDRDRIPGGHSAHPLVATGTESAL